MSKAKLLSPKGLEGLYTNSIQFKQKIENAADEINIRLKRLSDPENLASMSGGQGEACAEAIRGGVATLDEMVASIKITANFIDEKLEGAVMLARDKHGMADNLDKTKQIKNDVTIKR